MSAKQQESTQCGNTTTQTNTTPDKQLVTSCHCGQVSITMPSTPAYLNECHCTACYKYGGIWAYYPRSSLTFDYKGADEKTALHEYVRQDISEEERGLAFVRCAKCGCMTHWWGIGAYTQPDWRMGVNVRMLPEETFQALRVERRIKWC